MKPPKVQTAYLYYNIVTCKKLKEDEGLPHKDAFKKVGELWGKMTDEDKKPYKELEEKDRERREGQLAMQKEKGYFLMKDGTKSSEVEISGKKKRASSSKSKVSKASKGKARGKDSVKKT